MNKISQKTILITGCSSGIGLGTAYYLRDQGWRVFASCRKPDDCERLINEGFEAPLLDYRDQNSLEAGVAELLSATGGRLDALFNNGAFASPGFLEDLPREALNEIFETNVFGVHALTKLVLPIMRKQGYGRIIQNSSVLGLTGAKFRGAYVATKYAIEGMADTMRLELSSTNIDVILIEPGPISSKIRENSIPQFEKWIDWKNSVNKSFYEKIAMPRLYKVDGKKDFFELPEIAVAKKIETALLAKRPKARYYVTTPTYLIAWARRIFPPSLKDWLANKA